MAFTMVGEKECNAATQTSTMRGYVCGASSKLFNDLSIRTDVRGKAFSFSIAILHARIRLLKSTLLLSYNLPIIKLQLRSEADTIVVKERKAAIQVIIFRQRIITLT